VGADAFTIEGELTFRHGMPMLYTASLERGPFLHPDFVFGPAAFFRSMAEDDAAPLFLRAYDAGWHLYTPTAPAIRLVWDAPVAPCRVDPSLPMCEGFRKVFGVDFENGALSAQSRRGMIAEELSFRMKVPFAVKAQDAMLRLKQKLPFVGPKNPPDPLCVTLYTAAMPEETGRWLQRLATLKHLPLLAYAEPLLLRRITDFLPNVMEFKPRYMMDVPVDAPQVLQTLSKAAILARARDRELTHSHYVWLDADCVQYPVYDRTVFYWSRLCTDRIVLSTVNTVPDPSMVVVPEALVLPLAQEMTARAQWWLDRRGTLPTETELWQLVVRENPDWFQLQPLPVARQLFTLLHEVDV
jgi:hypothetical protein